MFTNNTSGDLLCGGKGNDFLIDASGNDKMFDGIINGGAEADMIYGGDDNDRICGEKYDDSLSDRGDDILDGGDGNDTYILNPGDGIPDGMRVDAIYDNYSGNNRIVFEGSRLESVDGILGVI